MRAVMLGISATVKRSMVLDIVICSHDGPLVPMRKPAFMSSAAHAALPMLRSDFLFEIVTVNDEDVGLVSHDSELAEAEDFKLSPFLLTRVNMKLKILADGRSPAPVTRSLSGTTSFPLENVHMACTVPPPPLEKLTSRVSSFDWL